MRTNQLTDEEELEVKNYDSIVPPTLNPVQAFELLSGTHQNEPLVIIFSVEQTKLNLERDMLRGSIKLKSSSLEN